MSMSIPFAWHEVRWQSAWNPYNVPQKDGTVVSQSLAGHAIVDGGVLSNFPIHLLTSSDQTARAIMGDAVVERSNVLGLLIDEEKDVPGAPPPPAEDEDDDEGLKGDLKKLRTVNRVRRLLDTMMDAHDKQAIATNADLICRLPAKTYGTMEFDMSEGRKAALVKAGEEAMNRHLAGR
jgi:predicted acylesterase/phospholipase RssA